MDKLPKGIRRKLEQIEKLDNKIVRLMNQINELEPKLKTAVLQPEMWEWDMYFRGSELLVTADTMEQTILEALNQEEEEE